MTFDDFDMQLQSDESIIADEYEDWLRYCAKTYEASEMEAHDVNSI